MKNPESFTESIELKIDREALWHRFITLESDIKDEELDEETLENLHDEYGVTGELILTKDYRLIYIDNAVINPDTLDDTKKLPVEGKYSIPELNILNASFEEIIEILKEKYF